MDFSCISPRVRRFSLSDRSVNLATRLLHQAHIGHRNTGILPHRSLRSASTPSDANSTDTCPAWDRTMVCPGAVPRNGAARSLQSDSGQRFLLFLPRLAPVCLLMWRNYRTRGLPQRTLPVGPHVVNFAQNMRQLLLFAGTWR